MVNVPAKPPTFGLQAASNGTRHSLVADFAFSQYTFTHRAEAFFIPLATTGAILCHRAAA
jgi:hypothetical protein